MRTVFIVNEPLRKDPETKEWVRMIDLAPAEEFGEIKFLLPSGHLPNDFSVTVERLMLGLVGYTKDDFILPVGDMSAAAVAVGIAMRVTGGCVRILRWNRSAKVYRPVDVDITGQPLAAHEEFFLGGLRHKPGLYALQRIGDVQPVLHEGTF
jgi:hypothetical protein